MEGIDRRKRICKILGQQNEPLSATRLAQAFGVSRQVIVQDVALLRAGGTQIVGTSRGYVMPEKDSVTRVFKVRHTDEETRDELNTIVDQGGICEDVFIYHRVYGVMEGKLNIRSRRDVEKYIHEIETGKSGLLKNATSGYHYHTVRAESESDLDLIQQELSEKGYLAPLQDYEPVDFWGEKDKQNI